ncbi:Pyridoxal phosphate homeostasis protein, partial [Fusarium oxysporum f. sp. albedinis]
MRVEDDQRPTLVVTLYQPKTLPKTTPFLPTSPDNKLFLFNNNSIFGHSSRDHSLLLLHSRAPSPLLFHPPPPRYRY